MKNHGRVKRVGTDAWARGLETLVYNLLEVSVLEKSLSYKYLMAWPFGLD